MSAKFELLASKGTYLIVSWIEKGHCGGILWMKNH